MEYSQSKESSCESMTLNLRVLLSLQPLIDYGPGLPSTNLEKCPFLLLLVFTDYGALSSHVS